MVDPLTGVYAALAQGEVVGAKYAVEEINKKGGILGRPVELLVEDSANDVEPEVIFLIVATRRSLSPGLMRSGL